MVQIINKKVFPNDTWYDLKTNQSQPDFAEAMLVGQGGVYVHMRDLIGIGQADCRGRNIMLASAIHQSGVAEQVRLVNRRVETVRGANSDSEQHTMVYWLPKGMASEPGNWRVADAFYQQFNGRLVDFETGVTGPTGRWNDPSPRTDGTVSISFTTLDRPIYMFGKP